MERFGPGAYLNGAGMQQTVACSVGNACGGGGGSVHRSIDHHPHPASLGGSGGGAFQRGAPFSGQSPLLQQGPLPPNSHHHQQQQQQMSHHHHHSVDLRSAAAAAAAAMAFHHAAASGGTPFGVGFMFTQDDLDMALYGYAKNRGEDQVVGHSLSGLRIGELSYGIY